MRTIFDANILAYLQLGKLHYRLKYLATIVNVYRPEIVNDFQDYFLSG
jgi:hypothetical protein